MAENLLIVGASARAAAFSALRAGLQPWCADLFADADLEARCPVQRVASSHYPAAFVDEAAAAPPGPWLYTGGLENSPEVVDRLANQRSLWGNGAQTLRNCREPDRWTNALLAERLPCPVVWRPVFYRRLPSSGRWLLKPLRGAGGSGIRPWNGEPLPGRALRGRYFQEYIQGEACSAVYVACRRTARLLGWSQQLIGEPWLRAPLFAYCGSVTKTPPPSEVGTALERLGNVLAERCWLAGLFGVDCILRDGVPYPVEVNPRYTASVEVLEYASGTSLLAQHRAVFEPTSQRLAFRARPALSELIGKAILFAKDDLTFPSAGPWLPTLRTPGDIWDMPAFADIPHAGEPIEKGKPILTFFARGPTEAAVLATLQGTAADLERWLFRS